MKKLRKFLKEKGLPVVLSLATAFPFGVANTYSQSTASVKETTPIVSELTSNEIKERELKNFLGTKKNLTNMLVGTPVGPAPLSKQINDSEESWTRPLIDVQSYDVNSGVKKKASAKSTSFSKIAGLGAAFLTNLGAHELGHKVVADYSGAEGTRLSFFNESDNQFYLGLCEVDKIDKKSNVPYHFGGEVGADVVFEHALKSYRNKPTDFNKSLLLFSGTDLLRYSAFTLLSKYNHDANDLVPIANEIGLSQKEILGIAVAKTLANAYRVYSGKDDFVPMFFADKYNIGIKVHKKF